MGLFKKLFGNKKEEVKEVPEPVIQEPEVTEPVVQGPAEPVKPAKPVKTIQDYEFKVKGISFRQDDIVKHLMVKNDEYSWKKKDMIEFGDVDELVRKYVPDIIAVELVPEPDNPEDEKAIKVVVDGVHIGYVPKSKTTRVRNIFKKNNVISVTCDIYGGPYKVLEWDYDDRGKDVYSIREGESSFGATVNIRYK